jgi:hypothetical protein
MEMQGELGRVVVEVKSQIGHLLKDRCMVESKIFSMMREGSFEP